MIIKEWKRSSVVEMGMADNNSINLTRNKWIFEMMIALFDTIIK